ncbi:MAG: hypothetical protein ABW130_19375 [Candidatus Thiodiazotropha lotti]
MEQDLPERAAVITKANDHGDEKAKGTQILSQFINTKGLIGETPIGDRQA